MSRALLAVGLGGLLACGGGGGSTSTPPPQQTSPPVDISGAWTATASGTTYHALVLPTTYAFRSLDSNVLEGSGTFTVSGNALGGSIVIFPSALYAAGGYPKQNGTIGGTVSSTAINDTITVPLGTVSIDLAPDPAANVAVQLASLAGNYVATSPQQTSSGLGGTFTLTAAGALTGSDPKGALSGTLTAVAPGLNAFNAALTYTPASGTAQTYTGLAYLLQGSPSVLVLMTDDGSTEFSGYFQMQ
jgi:hypothetical protein